MFILGFITFALVVCVSANRSVDKKVNSINDYHLPNNTKPQSYDISLVTNIDRNDFEFTGSVNINLVVLENSDEIVLNARQLTIKSVKLVSSIGSQTIELDLFKYNDTTEFLTIPTRKTLNKSSEYKLTIDYIGQLQNDATGFHRSSYKGSKEKMK